MLSEMKYTHHEDSHSLLTNRAWPCGRHGETPTVVGGCVKGIAGSMGQSPLLSQEQGGELAGGPASQWKLGDWTTRRGRGVDGGGGHRPPRLSTSQRRGLPAGSPWDLPSLGLREHRGGDR